MPWLLRDGDVLAALDDRRKGWQSSLRGAILLRSPAVAHTLTVRVALDVARCGEVALDGGVRGLQVRRTASLRPRRLGVPHLGPGALLVAPSGSFERWALQVGDRLEVRGE